MLLAHCEEAKLFGLSSDIVHPIEIVAFIILIAIIIWLLLDRRRNRYRIYE